MPSDANGVYTLPDGYLAVTGETILASQHNPPLEDLASSMTLRMMRSGATPMTGALKAISGTASAPGYSFSDATTTGLFLTGSGNLGVAIGGTQVAEFSAAGLKSGSRLIGELIAYTGSTAPPLWVLPYGQTLDRMTYAALWAFAQTEIAAGNTFFNNGNGSTTFGIGDLRGRLIAGKDDIGGSAALRLTSTYFGTSAAVLGAAGGSESHTLTLGQAPTGITSSGSISVAPNGASTTWGMPYTPTRVSDPAFSADSYGGGVNSPLVKGNSSNTIAVATSMTGTASLTSNNTGGNAHNNVQPTMICSYLLFAGA